MAFKEVKISKCPQVYRLVEIGVDGKERLTSRFRVRKRVKVGEKWTTRVQTFDSFEDAKYFARTISIPNTSASKTVSLVFEEVFERYLDHKRTKDRIAQSSLDGYRARARHLKFFATFQMNQITTGTVDTWLDLMFDADYIKAQQKTRVSYEHEYFLLSGLFNYYRNHEDSEYRSPLLERHRDVACKRDRSAETKEIRYLSADEEVAFLDELKKNETHHDVALFQLHTGARIGEVAALEFSNVDFHSNEVRIASHLHWERKEGSRIFLMKGTKGGPSRRVFLTNDCRRMLIQRKERATSTRVFTRPCGEWFSYRSLQAAYDQVFRKLGLPHRGTHTLRHTFAVRFLDQTKDVHALQRLLGHSDLKDTLRYGQYTNEAVRRAFQLFRGGLAGDFEGRRSTTRSTELTLHQNLQLV